MTGLTVLLIIGAIVVVLALAYMGIYNKLVRLRNDCHEGFATMDVYLKKRFDLLPNLVETVKGYAKHESETLAAVIAARNAGASQSMEGRLQDENAISGALRQIFALTESYPDLKANQNFMDLQAQMQRLEEDIANSRKYYNAVVKGYNNVCMMFPSSIVAGMAHFEPGVMFEIDSAERENIAVKF